MSNTVLGNAFKNVADAIRAKGVTGTMSPVEMPAKVASISTGTASKYGVDMDGMLGDITTTGGKKTLNKPTDTFSFQSNDIRGVVPNGLEYKFYGAPITSISLPNLRTLSDCAM